MLYFLIRVFETMHQGSRLIRKSQESLPCACCSRGREVLFSGLFGAVCLLTTHSANKGSGGDVRGAAAQCLGKLECGLQSKRTLIWTNTAVAWYLSKIKQRGCVDMDVSLGPSKEIEERPRNVRGPLSPVLSQGLNCCQGLNC